MAHRDGLAGCPGDSGFAYGGWSVNYWDDKMGQIMGEFMGTPYDLVLGRKTYEIFAAHWPHITDDPAAETLNRATSMSRRGP